MLPLDADINVAIASFVKLVPDEARRKFYVRVFKWVVAFAIWRYPRVDRTVASREEAATAARTSAALAQLQKSMAAEAVGQDVSNGTSATTRSAVSSVKPAQSRDTVAQTVPSKGMKPAANASSTTKDSSHMSRASLRSPAGTSKGSTASAASPAGGGLGAKTSAIPFSERQSRSQVAVHEALKRGRQATFGHLHTKTDQVLSRTIGEYGR